MSNFKVGLKKVVDDSYEVQIGKNLVPELVKDLTGGLVGNIHKFAVTQILPWSRCMADRSVTD